VVVAGMSASESEQKGFVTVERDGPLGWVRLADPDRRNALGPSLVGELSSVLRTLERDPSVRVVILSSVGKHFCAGGDIAVFDKTVAGGRDYVYDVIEVFRQIERLRKPVVASIRGYTLGGGFELAMSCDLIIASVTTQLGLPETSIGAVPAFALFRLTELMGRSTTKEIVWLQRKLTATEGVSAGLIAEAVADEDLESRTREVGLQLAAIPRVALELSKAAINGDVVDRTLFASTSAAAVTWGTDAIAEGRRAFYEKRSPVFPEE
jgi:enoyl-CoA hydratase/carnithine racemase